MTGGTVVEPPPTHTPHTHTPQKRGRGARAAGEISPSLLSARKKKKTPNGTAIASRVPGRDSIACRRRWKQVLELTDKERWRAGLLARWWPQAEWEALAAEVAADAARARAAGQVRLRWQDIARRLGRARGGSDRTLDECRMAWSAAKQRAQGWRDSP